MKDLAGKIFLFVAIALMLCGGVPLIVLKASGVNPNTAGIVAEIVIVAVMLVGTNMLIHSTVGRIKEIIRQIRFMTLGDFTQEMPSDLLLKKDELGDLAGSIQRLQFSIGRAIRDVKTETGNVSSNVNNEQTKLESLFSQIQGISDTTKTISESSQATAATTQELSSTAEEIGSSIDHVAASAEQGLSQIIEIKERADRVRSEAEKAKDKSVSMYDSSQVTLRDALDNAKEVEKINDLSSAILGIAEQTNLLALNASIEAARAGEAGRGFSVVATEISKLADNSKDSAAQIQSVTNEVIASVENLSNCAYELLNFMETNVLKDYDILVKTGEEYSSDATDMNKIISEFKDVTVTLKSMIDATVEAIENVEQANTEAADGTMDIARSADDLLNASDEVVNYAKENLKSTEKLNQVVDVFKLS
ncbi:MAG: methyl-accepting chemotaxis protein [Lachnospiraceae bacterium]|nr:methyl-accepting chemotaxis protein [Lachnospiraceae bacterium]MEE3460655.1 methyl-accepting chemotaxis protein [Lachnospiraceae bacterium]